MAAWGEFRPTLEGVVVLTGLHIFGKSRAIGMPWSSDVKLDSNG